MKIFCISIFCFLLSGDLFDLYAQISKSKPVIDASAIDQWQKFSRSPQVNISNDGKHFSYLLETGAYPRPMNLVVQSTFDNWKMELPNAKFVNFSKDSKKYLFLTGDSLVILTLGTGELQYIKSVIPSSLQQPKYFQGETFVYKVRDQSEQLVLLNVLTGKQQHFEGVKNYQFSDDGTALLLRIEEVNNNPTSKLEIIDIDSGRETIVWQSSDTELMISSFTIDRTAKQCAFTISEKRNGDSENSIWYWSNSVQKSVEKINRKTIGIGSGLQIISVSNFSDNGKFLHFNLQPEFLAKPEQDEISVDVWSTRDTILQSQQLLNPYPRSLTYVLNLSDNKIIPFLCEWDIWNKINSGNEDYAVVTHNSRGDQFWLKQADSTSLLCFKDGSRTLLPTKGPSDFWFSPDGRYLLYYDAGREGSYFSYDLEKRHEVKISGKIPAHCLSKVADYVYIKDSSVLKDSSLIKGNIWLSNNLNTPVGVAGFANNGKNVFVYDNFDIWKMDLTGIETPVNITNGYGRRNHIKFRILHNGSPDFFYWRPPVVETDRPQILTGYNTESKYNGFFKQKLSTIGNPNSLFMGPFQIYTGPKINLQNQELSLNFVPLKAKNANEWIVMKESTSEAPNFFLTSDFKEYKPLTNLQPQTGYNWLTAELLNFTRSDGIKSQGVLYKPENFDSSKKYPLIIFIYETLSKRLYQFPQADFTRDADINIPWFTSHGYLVFTPDIYEKYDQSKLKSSLLTVEAAIKTLLKYKYVDDKRLGISGHSKAGGRVAYIISHSTLFAAAFEGAGNTDALTSTLWINLFGQSRLHNELAIGVNLWQKPDWYLDNSVTHADDISTPLLIFHCKGDGVQFEQGVELYLALRRLGKSGWMLQYDDGGHVLDAGTIRPKDLTIRSNQFFDHYLKGAPAPFWMTHGIPARLKGIEFGYTYDPSGNCGAACKVCKMWNERWRKDSAATMKEIQGKIKTEHWMEANGEVKATSANSLSTN
jgi:dipeptidyl aminopeptidase/acylaminoacyl peptidase